MVQSVSRQAPAKSAAKTGSCWSAETTHEWLRREETKRELSTNGFANTNCMGYSARHVCIGSKYGSHWNVDSFIYRYMQPNSIVGDNAGKCHMQTHSVHAGYPFMSAHAQIKRLASLVCVITIREERASILFAG